MIETGYPEADGDPYVIKWRNIIMSYDIVKGIQVRDGGEVWVQSASSNVRPHYHNWWHCTAFTALLAKQGAVELDAEILLQYENGNFHAGGKNRYTRALQVLRHMPEYPEFDWRGGLGPEYDQVNRRRASSEFHDMLKLAMKTMLPKEKYIIRKKVYGSENEYRYLWKITGRYVRWTIDKKNAKVFRYKIDADNYRENFITADDWGVEKIK
jgi:hypothetical protein